MPASTPARLATPRLNAPASPRRSPMPWVKAADVCLLGLEPNGTEGICIRIGADTPAALQAALDEAEIIASLLLIKMISSGCWPATISKGKKKAPLQCLII